MTPKEKAEELCRKMLFQIEWNAQPSTVKGIAKECALIAVDEILLHEKNNHSVLDKSTDYWEEVKSELEEL
jgi:hypothetical protein